MNPLVAFLILGTMIAVPVSLVIAIIRKIRHKPAKPALLVALIALIVFVVCCLTVPVDNKQQETAGAVQEEASPEPTAVESPEVTPTSTPTITPEVTQAPSPTSTPLTSVQSKPTSIPKATNTPKPTIAPTATPKSTARPKATPTPKSTSTPKPTATPSPTPIAVEYDALQEVFMSFSDSTTEEDVLSAIGSYGLSYTREEYNGTPKSFEYKVAYTDGVAKQKYADSGDSVEITFNKDDGSFMYVEYNHNFKSAFLYNYGTYWDLREETPQNSYSGYYWREAGKTTGGITITYSNGNGHETGYHAVDTAAEAIAEAVK